MLIPMLRTTLVLDDGLVEAAKIHAARDHTTFSEVVNAALRQYLQPSRAQDALVAYRVQPFGDPTAGLTFEPADLQRILDDQDQAGLR
jgi:hypothetical protein